MSGRRWPRRVERWLERVVRLVPPGEGAHVREELERLYASRLERDGEAAAYRRLRREVLAFVPGAVRQRLRSAGQALSTTWDDVVRSGRGLVRAPGFAGVVVATLGVGIGAAALVFTVVDGVLLSPLPYAEPERLVDVWGAMTRGELSEIRSRTRTLVSARGYFDNGAGVNLEVGGQAYRLPTSYIEPGLFAMLGARPLLGRLFDASESEPGRTQVTILGEGLWRSVFASDPGILGRTVTLDGRPYRVVGVLPSSWRFPDPADRLWLPLDWDPAAAGPFWGSGGIRVIGRLAPGRSAAAAQEELRDFAPAISEANPVWTPAPGYREQALVTPLRDALVSNVRRTLLVLFGAVALVLLVVCVNVSSLLVARALERGRLVAVRAALGASRARVTREALAESGLLGVAGAALGVLLARGGLALLRPSLIGRLPRAAELHLNGGVLALAVAAGLATGVVAGIVPAFRAAQRDPGDALRTGGRGGGPGVRRRRLSRLLVGFQVAAAVVLVAGALLLTRTLAAVGAVDPGFRTDGLLTAEVTFPADRPGDAAAYDALLTRIRAVPGVRDAAAAGTVPFGPLREAYATFIEGVTTDPNDLPSIDADRVSPAYFDVMGIPLVEGRTFTATDHDDAPLVAIIDERMSNAYWPGGSAVGHRIRFPWVGAPWLEIVGVVGSVADDDVTAPGRPRWYMPLAQHATPNLTLVITSSLPGAAVMAGVRRAVADVDPRLPVSHEAAYADLLGDAASRTRITARVLLAFALATLLLGGLGVFGLCAQAVRERRREIGVRMALGAASSSIGVGVVREGLRVVGPAAIAGLALAAAGTRTLGGLLYGVAPLDPLTFAAVPLVILAAALLAVWIPAHRAARVDPVESLREG